jgi:small subunit ribosomal protein S8
MMTDPIADMLNQIRNALAVNAADLVLPYSRLKAEIADILVKHGYLESAEKAEKVEGSPLYLEIKLKYIGKKPVISNLKRISLPSRRVYVKKDELPAVLNNLGLAIVSTSRGLMTNKEARKLGLGGEVICEVY